jgi:hypothetical protein
MDIIKKMISLVPHSFITYLLSTHISIFTGSQECGDEDTTPNFGSSLDGGSLE